MPEKTLASDVNQKMLVTGEKNKHENCWQPAIQKKYIDLLVGRNTGGSKWAWCGGAIL